MQPFDIAILIRPSLIIFFATVLLAFIVTRSPIFSISAAFMKMGIFLTYFGLLFDGTFTSLDDWIYLEGGKTLYRHGVGLTNIIDNLDILFGVAGGRHVVYYLYNAYSFTFFGIGYYSPVAFNILATLAIAFAGTYTANAEFNFGKKWRNIFFGFLLIYPNTLIWSNIFNGKDILVLLAHILLLMSTYMLFNKRYLACISIGIPTIIILFFLRFYVPLVFSAAFIASVITGRRLLKDFRYTIYGTTILILIFSWHGFDTILSSIASLKESFVNPFYGFVHFALTPIPLNTQESYRFLELPALLHWLLIPFAVLGIYNVIKRKTKFSKFFLFYAVFFVGLYSVFDGLQGPRHRVQLDYAWATFQFIGIKLATQFFLKNSRHRNMCNRSPQSLVSDSSNNGLAQ